MVQAVNKIEEETQQAAAEVQLQNYGRFVEQYTANLDRLSAVFDQSATSESYVSVVFAPHEYTDARDLIRSDNQIVDKVLTVFVAILDEIAFANREANNQYLNLAAYYGEGISDNMAYEDGQLTVSKMIPKLQALSHFIKYIERLLLDCLTQLSAFYDLQLEIANANLYNVFDAMGDLLLTILSLDETLGNNQVLIYHWSLYQHTIQLASHKASDLPYSARQMRHLQALANKLERQLFTRQLFESALAIPFDKKYPVRVNKRLEQEYFNYLRILHSELDHLAAHQQMINTTKLVKLFTSFVLYATVFGGSYDRKFLRQMAELQRRCPLVTVHTALLRLDEFTIRFLGNVLKPAERKLFAREANPQMYMDDITRRVIKETPDHAAKVLSWILRFEAKFMTNENVVLKTDYLNDMCQLLLSGIKHCSRMKALLSTASNLHVNIGKPMTKTSALSFCTIMELLKCVELAYSRQRPAVAKMLTCISQYLEYQCHTLLSNVRQTIVTDKSFKSDRVDIFSALVVAQDAFGGSATKLRLMIARLCLNLVGQQKCLNENEKKLSELIDTLNAVITLHDTIIRSTDCPFAHIQKHALPIYLANIEQRQDPTRATHLLAAVGDSLHALDSPDNFAEDAIDDAVHHLVQPTCRRVETDLRLHTLGHLQLGRKTLSTTCYDSISYRIRAPLRLDNRRIDVKFEVEQYLDRTFYDLTTVALHDWQIYGEMRTLAEHKFQLHTIDDNLPNHTLEQGLDLLEITRNVQSFVATHNYNLNNQIFVERESPNKHLNTVNIQHTANSIRTHGAGITSTAINYTYQYLRKRLTLVSQFLYDERIKSRLLKDIHTFEEMQTKYPYEKAERFNRGMHKMGLNAEGLTYLDQLRVLITRIGNALGYVRLIRSGSLRYYSRANEFLTPEHRTLDSLCADASACVRDATRLADELTQNVRRHVCDDGSNYFKSLVDVFIGATRSAENSHLRNFYALVPALTINFVERIIAAKEALTKKKTMNAFTFTDDGFAMGIAYLLQVFQQNEQFDSLRWFESVSERNAKEFDKLTVQFNGLPKEDANLNHTLNLSLKRLDVFKREFLLLYYNLYSARILFHGHGYMQHE